MRLEHDPEYQAWYHGQGNTAFIFASPQPILDALEVCFTGPKQHDAHVVKYNAVMRAYGSNEGYLERMAELAELRRARGTV